MKITRETVAVLAGLATSILFGLGSFVTHPRPGLDPSYQYAVHHASAAGLVWGREFMATYGFLGYVLNPLAYDGFPARWLVFQLALVAGTALAAWAYARTTDVGRRPQLALPAVVAVVYGVHVQALEQRWVGLVLLIVLVARGVAGPSGAGLWGLAGLLGGVLLQAKVSLGLGAILTAGAAALLWPVLRLALGRALAVGTGATLGTLAAWLWHYGSLDGLPHWLGLALESASGYSSAMSLAPPETGVVVLGFVAALVALGAWAAIARADDGWARLVVCLVPLWVAWKHSVVRLDVYHVGTFPLFLMLCGLLLALDSPPTRRAQSALSVLGLAWALALGSWTYLHVRHTRDGVEHSAPWVTLVEPLKLPGLAGARQALDPTAARARWTELSKAAFAGMVLPQLSQVLAGAGVDVYPWEAGWIGANGLNWQLRPSFASFASYTPRLDRMNAAFFTAAGRPPFLIWHLLSNYGGAIDSIDERHVFWDEPGALLAILGHYDVAATHRGFLLLHERAAPRLQQRTLLGTSSVGWGQSLALPAADGPLIGEITLPRRSPWAAARRALFRDEPAYIALEFEDGEIAAFRFVPEQAGTGLWLSPLPRNEAELGAMLGGGRGPRVSAIAFKGPWAAPDGPPVEVKWWALR